MMQSVSEKHLTILELGKALGYFGIDSGGCCHGISLRWLEACLTAYCVRTLSKQPDESDLERVRTLNEILIIHVNDKFQIGFCNKKGEFEQKFIDNIDIQQFLQSLSEEPTKKVFLSRKDINSLLESETLLSDDEETILNSHVDTILHDRALPQKIQLLNEKVRERKSLAVDDLALFNIIAFFESVKIYHFSEEHPDLFDAQLKQRDIEQTSQFASSIKMEAQGGLVPVYSEQGIYSRAELITYLGNLEDEIDDIADDYPSSTKIGILLCSYRHAMAITYQSGRWVSMDINQWPAQSFSFSEQSTLVDYITNGFQALKENKSSPYFALQTTVITTGHDPRREKLRDKLHAFKKTHVITRELAMRQEDVSLVHIAALNGDTDVIKTLGALGVDFERVSEDGLTPLYCAANRNETAVISLLADYGVNLNTHIKNGFSPVHVAANLGNTQALAELIHRGANINVGGFSTHGDFPIHLAAAQGRVREIQMLVDHGADVNAMRPDGITPLFFAASRGHIDALKMLADRGAHLNAKAKDSTPIFMAACCGQKAVVAELIKLGVPFDENMPNGYTPLFGAVQHGHAAIAFELIRLGANKDITLPTGETLLCIASLNGYANVVRLLLEHHCSVTPYDMPVDTLRSLGHHFAREECDTRINSFIQDKMPIEHERDIILVTPFEIAFLLGHEDTIQVFQELVPETSHTEYLTHEIAPATALSKNKATLFKELLLRQIKSEEVIKPLTDIESSLLDIVLPIKKS